MQTERLMLNIMQRMSGIATMTDKYVQRLKGRAHLAAGTGRRLRERDGGGVIDNTAPYVPHIKTGAF